MLREVGLTKSHNNTQVFTISFNRCSGQEANNLRQIKYEGAVSANTQTRHPLDQD